MKLSEKSTNIFLFLIILSLSFFFLFKNLGDIPFWQDEGETAVIGLNTLTFGIPTAWDGKNLISSLNGYDFNDKLIWTWHPWSQFYITALSFYLFGKSTFSGRLPFALSGFFTIILTYLLTSKMTKDKKTALLSAFFLTTNLQFILFCRQCRYYALLPFFSILAAYFITEIDKRKGFYGFIISMALLFHSNYAPFPFVMAGGFLYLIYLKNKEKLTKYFLSIIPISILTIPWFVYSEAYKRGTEIPISERMGIYFLQLQDMLYLVNEYMFPLLLLLPLFYLFSKNFEDIRKISLLCLSFAFPVILFLPYVSYTQFIIGIRYATGCFPFMAIISAVSIMTTYRKNKIAGTLIIFILIFTNILSFIPSYTFRMIKEDDQKYKRASFSEEIRNALIAKKIYADFIYELTHHYKSPIEGISNFLNKNASEEDIVLTNYEHAPIIFYTNRRMAYILSNERYFRESIPAPKFNEVLMQMLPNYIFSYENIDWLIERSNYPERLYGFNSLKRNLQKNGFIEKVYYLSYPDIPWSNRADLRYHKFRTPVNFPSLKIYKVKKNKKS
ncbi:MAG: hypothetical protein D6734_07055 [Candidatus Schekmanbacteria bacterium]|nr:MAG: hypothetical protein D6734_07055 [Candidatus Schekmanbacteria bacterium]